ELGSPDDVDHQHVEAGSTALEIDHVELMLDVGGPRQRLVSDPHARVLTPEYADKPGQRIVLARPAPAAGPTLQRRDYAGPPHTKSSTATFALTTPPRPARDPPAPRISTSTSLRRCRSSSTPARRSRSATCRRSPAATV